MKSAWPVKELPATEAVRSWRLAHDEFSRILDTPDESSQKLAR